AMLMVVALTIRIALLFTIGKSKCDDDASNFNHAEPYDCGCQAISSQIRSRIVNGEEAIPNSWP
ncbi:unnamed protein product, partial [Rotaria magnacalcarata]